MVAKVPSGVMNITDTCPCTTDRHHERPSQGNYQSGRGSTTRQQWPRLAAQLAEKGSPRGAPSRRHKAAPNCQTGPKGVNG